MALGGRVSCASHVRYIVEMYNIRLVSPKHVLILSSVFNAHTGDMVLFIALFGVSVADDHNPW